MAVQANHDSIDQSAAHCARGSCVGTDEERDGRSRSAGHDRRAAPGGRPRLVSIIKRTGVPDDRDGDAEQRTPRIELAEYPQLPRDSGTPSPLPEGLGSRATEAVVVSQAINDELESLRLAWGVAAGGGAKGHDGPEKPEEAFFTCLKHIAKRAERRAVLKALEPPQAKTGAQLPGSTSASEAVLLARRERDREELSIAKRRLRDMEALDAEVSRSLEAGRMPFGCDDALQDLATRLSSSSPAEATEAESSAALTGRAEEGVSRLALVELWLHGTLSKLQEVTSQLDERERATSERAFAHLSDKEADPRSVLLSFT